MLSNLKYNDTPVLHTAEVQAILNIEDSNDVYALGRKNHIKLIDFKSQVPGARGRMSTYWCEDSVLRFRNRLVRAEPPATAVVADVSSVPLTSSPKRATLVTAGRYRLRVKWVDVLNSRNAVRPTYEVVLGPANPGTEVRAGGFYFDKKSSADVSSRHMEVLGLGELVSPLQLEGLRDALTGMVFDADITINTLNNGSDANGIVSDSIAAIGVPA